MTWVYAYCRSTAFLNGFRFATSAGLASYYHVLTPRNTGLPRTCVKGEEHETFVGNRNLIQVTTLTTC